MAPRHDESGGKSRLWRARSGDIAVVALAAIFSLPSLATGLFDDDVWHRRFLLDQLHGTAASRWWQLFGVPLPDGLVENLAYHGIVPWWTSPNFQLSFFRPLAVLTHYLDYAAWPDVTWLMHLQNVGWYVLLCLLAVRLYRRALGPGAVSAIAGLLYAMDGAHLEAVAWIAARNSILTAVFAVLTLIWLDEQTRKRGYRYSLLAALSVCLAHLSSEGAAAVWAYVLGAQLSCPRQTLRRALAVIAPAAVVSVGWSAFTAHSRYIIVGSGAYIDPRVRPGEFAAAVVERLPRLLSEQFGPPAWLWELLQDAGIAQPSRVAFLVGWAIVCWIGLPRVWRSPGLRALLVGSLGSAVVVCGARPEPRLLLIVGLGAHALSAALLVAFWQTLPFSSGLQRVGLWFAAAWIATLHGVLEPVSSFRVPESYRQRHLALSASAERMELRRGDSERVVALLNSPSYFEALRICTYRLEQGPRPWRSVHILGSSPGPVTLSRPAPDRLLLEPADKSGYLIEQTSQQARSPDEQFFPGQTTPLDGLRVVVDSVTSDHRPERIRLDLPADQAQRIDFLTWDPLQKTFRRVALPDVGGQLAL